MSPNKEIRRLLDAVLEDTEDRDEAAQRIFDAAYQELHEVAARLMRAERPDHTLQPTALVHEAYVRMFAGENLKVRDRAHFLAFAAKVMRQVLIDHARRHSAEKRGGDFKRVLLQTDIVDPSSSSALDILAIESCLVRLAKLDTRIAEVVELKVFGGLTVPDISSALGTSPRTVDTDWAFGRAWMSRELSR